MTPRHRPAPRRAAPPGKVRPPAARGSTPRPAPRGSTSRPAPRAWHAWLRSPVFFAALAAALVYLPTLGYGFVWDDHSLIETNVLLRSTVPRATLVTSDFWIATGGTSGYWRPLIVLSYWLDGRLSGFGPAWFHAVNLLAHALASGLVAAVLLQNGIGAAAATLGALWFAVAPSHAECVAFVAGRTDAFCALFALVALALDRRARRSGRHWARWGAVVALALALFAKEAAAAGFLILLLLDRCDPGAPRRGLASTLRWVTPYAAVTALYLGLHAVLVPPPAVPPDPAGWAGRWVAWKAYPLDLLMLLPGYPHAPGHALRYPERAGDPVVLLGIALQIGTAILLALWTWRRSRLAPALAWFWLTLLPVIVPGLLRGNVPFAERFLYLPSIGIVWILSDRIPAWARRAGPGGPRVAAIAAAALVVASAVETVSSSRVWSRDETVFRRIVAHEPRSAIGYVGLADALLRQGRMKEARETLDAGRRVVPADPGLDVIEANWWAQQGDWRRVLAISERGLRDRTTSLEARLQHATALMKLGRLDGAFAELDSLRRDQPSSAATQAMWAECQVLRGHPGEAIPVLEQSAPLLALSDPWYVLGMARAQLGQFAAARDAFTECVRRDPNNYNGWLRLAVASQLTGDPMGRDQALTRAAALPQARDGRVEAIRRGLAAGPRRP